MFVNDDVEQEKKNICYHGISNIIHHMTRDIISHGDILSHVYVKCINAGLKTCNIMSLNEETKQKM